jgi:hypothetical protein
MTNKITIIKGRRFSDLRIACKRDSLNDYHDISIRGNRHVVINESKFKVLRTGFGSAKCALLLQMSDNDILGDLKPHKIGNSSRFWTNPFVLSGM